MYVYVLRHEARGRDASYNSTLTKQGLSYSINLADRLKKLDIGTIYCSPFVRAIQTIHPYSVKNNVKINIDFALIEYIAYPEILDKSFHVTFTDNELDYWNINPTYISSVKLEDLSMGKYNFCEASSHIDCRTGEFLDVLKRYINGIDGNVLIVSHQATISSLWKHIHSRDRELDMGEIDRLM
tara:strand:- start:73 stop:621 length:549 start_codon:yes stop_codon:yes gene_type:complete